MKKINVRKFKKEREGTYALAPRALIFKMQQKLTWAPIF